MLSCLTKRAWLTGWTLLLLVMTWYFFFFCLSRLSELDSIQPLPNCQHWTQNFPVFRTNVVISFQEQHLKAYFSLLLSSPHQICLSFFLERWHWHWGGEIWLLYSLATLPFSWNASLGVCSDAGVGMWLTAELEWLFPIWFRAAVRDNECQYPTAGAWFCCVYV